jgi:uncharacterized protein
VKGDLSLFIFLIFIKFSPFLKIFNHKMIILYYHFYKRGKYKMIHKYRLFDNNIVIDINSNSVHVFDDIAYEIVDFINDLNESEIIDKFKDKYEVKIINEVYKELSELIHEGFLYSKETQIEPDFTLSDSVKALCLHIAHDCNLKCKYCFAGEGNYNIGKNLMSYEVGKKAIDFVIKASKNRKNIEIDFFGGEPLINFDVVKKIVAYARDKEDKFNKKFRFTLTTNGVLLDDEIIKYINENMSNVVLSIDGRKEVNDRMRIGYDKKSTYEKIMPNFKKVSKLRNQENYFIRGTYTRNNLDFSNDVLHLADEGFKQVSVEPVVANKDSGFEIREEDVEKIEYEYEKLALEYINRLNTNKKFNFFHFNIDLNEGPCILKRASGCGAGFDYVAITPEGDIYPCHQFVGDENFKLGNVESEKLNKNIMDKFKSSNVYTKKDCKDCWAKFYCSGGCAANAYQFNNDINIPYEIACKLQKKRIECAIWIKINENES